MLENHLLRHVQSWLLLVLFSLLFSCSCLLILIHVKFLALLNLAVKNERNTPLEPHPFWSKSSALEVFKEKLMLSPPYTTYQPARRIPFLFFTPKQFSPLINLLKECKKYSKFVEKSTALLESFLNLKKDKL